MALTKCKECGKEVSTQAKLCPGCGAKIGRKGIGVLGLVGVTFTIGAIGSAFNAPNNTTSIAQSTIPSPPPLNPIDQAISKLDITGLKWHKEGGGTVMIVDATFKNNGARDVKDIKLKCIHESNSGTKIDDNVRTIYEIVRAGKSMSIKDFSMGFIHSQAKSTECGVVDLTLI